jgi:hypothetical protein
VNINVVLINVSTSNMAHAVNLSPYIQEEMIRMATGTLTTLTGAFRGFSQSLQANSGKSLQISHDRFLPHPQKSIIHQSTYNSTLYY